MNLLMTATPLAMASAATRTLGRERHHRHGGDVRPVLLTARSSRFGVMMVMAAGVVAWRLRGGGIGPARRQFQILVLLGVGWNFTTSAARRWKRPTAPEKAKAQGANEIVVFTVQGLSAFASGVLITSGCHPQLRFAADHRRGVAVAWLAFGIDVRNGSRGACGG